MHDFLPLLRCIARAVVRKGAAALEGLAPFRAFLDDMAASVFQEYPNDPTGDAWRVDLEALARIDPAEVWRAAEEVATREAACLPAEVRRTLVAYLAQVPVAVRQALRRPADPEGRTVPARRSPRVPQELVPFLPAGLAQFRPGDRPLADWELVELLGKGSLGEVWKARHRTRLRQLVALRFILDPTAAHHLRTETAVQDVLDRVRREGKGLDRVPLLEVHRESDPPCLVYAYAEGSDLAGLIREMHPEGKLTAEFASLLMQDLARAVASAHRLDPPLVHGNLKVSNVRVRRGDDNRLSLQMAEFGTGSLIARRLLPESVGSYSSRTPGLALAEEGGAPEPRDDVYALGVIWYQLVTGNPDLTDLPPDWRDVAAEWGLAEKEIRLLESCLAPRAEKRLPSAEELAERLGALADPLVDDPEPTPVPVGLTPRRGVRQLKAVSPRAGCAAADPPARSSLPATQPGEVTTIWLGQGVVLKFVWIPPGTFVMGSLPGEPVRLENETPHRVTLTKGFYLGVHPVTQAQWRAVMGNNPSRVKAANHPVEMVSWDSCVVFCKKLRQLTGKRFRLPTEAEWEYACRAGTTTAYHSGNGLEALRQVGWCSYDEVPGSAGMTQPVGLLQPNAWGLWDMHGNVWEWCRDWYAPYEGDAIDPIGPCFGTARVLRGGSWYYGPNDCRSARRVRKEPATRYADIGCRILLCPG